ncbi:alpha-1,2 glucosyltransferase ALG10 [Magnaporthiopsis poae ATCC 64411]|uniref:Dol-P-Glc:Glc(2)Man(9)GlcNAc(2)-PP-Dol alpha-1,2-glucosyltransferase n=1 Tax=Magnaporthiopsis poae (strain ATCC 64411 / 73-15) TaxID=644358 RepID=A0A0C4DNK5_MAGP6|nr:alpha-1,2 glucosyltransferase ALG10 [Magnaporthiopsis poae ATCC 64411]
MDLPLFGLVPKASLSIALVVVLHSLVTVGCNPRKTRIPTLLYRAGLVLLFALPAIWLRVVNLNVPEPYLDEVFHVPQAVRYLAGRWREWDDKITTPPGLYLISYLILDRPGWIRSLICGLVGGFGSLENLTATLRETNALAIFAIAYFFADCRQWLERRGASAGETASSPWPSLYALHSAFNVALFPAIFFFSGLYYTDLWSLVAVLNAYKIHLDRAAHAADSLSLRRAAMALYAGVQALAMRQTNVFWVVIYFGGLQVVEAVKSLPASTSFQEDAAKTSSQETPPNNRLEEDYRTWVRAYFRHWAAGNIHDPSLADANFLDIIQLAASLIVAVLCNLPRVLLRVWPEVLLLSIFGGFVAWNGGVVLGDKSNHVATIHLAQMLYIWPLFIFFSAPLLVGYVVPILSALYRAASRLPWNMRKQPIKNGVYLSCPCGFQHSKSPHIARDRCRTVMTFLLLGVSAVMAAAIVHLNTIIHPFTLADNRHYMFYVFRYTILKHPAVKYLLVPAYVLCHSLCWQLLSGCSHLGLAETTCRDCPLRSFNCSGAIPERVESYHSSPSSPSKNRAAEKTVRPAVTKEVDDAAVAPDTLQGPSSTSQRSAQPLSTALLWLLATALSLVTAPLVEPRYFIVPWVMWRVLVPAWKLHDCRDDTPLGPFYHGSDGGGAGATADDETVSLRRPLAALNWLGQRVDLRLLVETAWFAAINVATMYMFIRRPYVWRDAEGNVLDEGRLQRFMW